MSPQTCLCGRWQGVQWLCSIPSSRQWKGDRMGPPEQEASQKGLSMDAGAVGGCNSESILLLQKSESLHQVLLHLRMTGGSSSKSMVKWTRVIWSSSNGSITISTWKVVPSMVGRNAWCRKLWIPWPTTQTAKLCQRYDLTIVEFEPETRDIMEKIVPSLRHHALWLLGEAGKGKTPLGRVIAMMFSRYHGGQGTYRTTSDLDFFKGIPFTKKFPALFDDGNSVAKRWRRSRLLQTSDTTRRWSEPAGRARSMSATSFVWSRTTHTIQMQSQRTTKVTLILSSLMKTFSSWSGRCWAACSALMQWLFWSAVLSSSLGRLTSPTVSHPSMKLEAYRIR